MLRRTRLPALLGAVVATAGWFWFAGFVFYRGDLFLGFLPGPGLFSAVIDGIAAGAKTSTVEVAPVGNVKELYVIVSGVVWSATWLADDAVHKLRHPLLAIGFTLPIFVFPGTLIDSSVRWLDSGLFIAASLAVLFSDESIRLARWGRTAGGESAGWKSGLAVRIGTIVTLAAIALAPIVPGFARTPGEAGGGAGGNGDQVALNPLVSIAPRLRRTPATPLFTVKSSEPAYWRITALDFFNGEVWTAEPRNATLAVSDQTVAQAERGAPTRLLRQEVVLRGMAGPWLPAAYEPIGVGGRPNVRMERITRSLVSGSKMRPGQRYEVLSRVPTPKAEQLDAITSLQLLRDRNLAPYLILPQITRSRAVEELTRRLTRGEATPYRKALALQTHLRTFRYNEDVAIGHSYSLLEEFLLDVKEGYCEQFSAAMAVMARMAGIPSRVAIGFSSGSRVGDTYQVTSRHAHSWTELYFPGFGWLAFEPTPRADGTTFVPPYAQRESDGGQSTAEPTPTATAAPTATASPTEGRQPAEGDELGSFRSRNKPSPLRPVLIPLAVLVLGALIIPGGAEMKRRLRRKHASGPRAIGASHYLDFLDWCAAAGLPRSPGETPAEYAARLAEVAAPAERPLRELAGVTAATLWAPGLPQAAPERTVLLAREARAAIRPALPRRARALSLVGWGWWKR